MWDLQTIRKINSMNPEKFMEWVNETRRMEISLDERRQSRKPGKRAAPARLREPRQTRNEHRNSVGNAPESGTHPATDSMPDDGGTQTRSRFKQRKGR